MKKKRIQRQNSYWILNCTLGWSSGIDEEKKIARCLSDFPQISSTAKKS